MKYTRWMIPVILVLLVATTVMSALAYFSSTQTRTGTITSGDLELQLSNDGEVWNATADLPWDVSEMAPGQTKTAFLHMRNVGSVDAHKVTFDWSSVLTSPDTVDMAKHMFLTEAQDNLDPGNQIAAFMGIAGADGDAAHVSLYDLAVLTDGQVWSPTNDAATFLPAGATSWLKMTFQFDPAADNAYMNKTLTYNLTVKAMQIR